MKFKRSTPNFDKLDQLKHIYDKLESDSCIIPEDEEEMKVPSDQIPCHKCKCSSNINCGYKRKLFIGG